MFLSFGHQARWKRIQNGGTQIHETSHLYRFPTDFFRQHTCLSPDSILSLLLVHAVAHGLVKVESKFLRKSFENIFFYLLSPKNINKFNILHLTHINDENTYHDSSPPKTDESRIFTKFLRFSPSKQWKYR